MTKAQRARILFDGTVLLLVGMIAGIPFAVAIINGWGDEAVRAWRVAHTALLTTGLLYLVIAAIGSGLRLGRRAAALLTGLLRATTYVFAAALLIGPFAGARGLEPVGPALNALVFAVFSASVLAFFATSGLLCWGAYAASRASATEQRENAAGH